MISDDFSSIVVSLPKIEDASQTKMLLDFILDWYKELI